MTIELTSINCHMTNRIDHIHRQMTIQFTIYMAK